MVGVISYSLFASKSILESYIFRIQSKIIALGYAASDVAPLCVERECQQPVFLDRSSRGLHDHTAIITDVPTQKHSLETLPAL